MEALDQLRHTIFAVKPLPEEAWQSFAAIWQPVSFKRKDIITAAGQVENHLYFVLDGLQRAFCFHGDREATLVFTYKGSFSGVADSFLLRKPSRYYLEAITKSNMLYTHYLQLEKVATEHISIRELLYTSICHTFAGVLERQIELQVYSAEEKFRALLNRSPHILQFIPHKYLASYLGIDATTFSKLLHSVRL